MRAGTRPDLSAGVRAGALKGGGMVRRRKTQGVVMFKCYIQMPVEDLFANILLETRQISDGLRHLDVFSGAMERASFLRDLAMLSGHKWIDTEAGKNLDPIIRILEAELDAETTMITQVFHGHNDPDHGAVGSVEKRRELTARGESASSMLQSLRRLQCMLEVADARIKAERIVNLRLQV